MSQECMPLPGLALQVVITGHRPRPFDDQAKLTAAFRTAFDIIERGARNVVAAIPAKLYSDQPARWRVVSAIADGADRLGAAAAPAGWELATVLPMPREEYEKDFDAASRLEFAALIARAASVTELVADAGADLANPAIRALQYRRLGGFLARQADVLIAMWDGQPSGGPGGTGEVVGATHALGVPVLWIHSVTAEPAWLLALQPDGGAGPTSAVNDETTRTALAPLLGFEVAEGLEPARGLSFLQRPWPRRLHLAFGYQALRVLGGVGQWAWPLAYGGFVENRKAWERFCDLAPPTRTSVAVRARLAPASIWADAHAWAYGHIYRSAYISSFALAGAAPGLGLIYLFWIFNEHVLSIKAGFVLVELAMILIIVSLVHIGTLRNWHSLWLESRELAELVRQGRALAYIGALRAFAPALKESGDRNTAVYLTRAFFREIPPPEGRLDDAYLRELLSAYRATELDEQQKYHEANARNLAKLHHFLHNAGQRSFIATAVTLAIYLVFWIADLSLGRSADGEPGLLHEALEFVVKPIVSILAAGLPAIGAAISGIAAQADFRGFASRSRATAAALKEIRARLDARLALIRPIEPEEAGRLLNEAAGAIVGEVGSWRRTYADKRLMLPG